MNRLQRVMGQGLNHEQTWDASLSSTSVLMFNLADPALPVPVPGSLSELLSVTPRASLKANAPASHQARRLLPLCGNFAVLILFVSLCWVLERFENTQQ
jgi:hypothetical protein